MGLHNRLDSDGEDQDQATYHPHHPPRPVSTGRGVMCGVVWCADTFLFLFVPFRLPPFLYFPSYRGRRRGTCAILQWGSAPRRCDVCDVWAVRLLLPWGGGVLRSFVWLLFEPRCWVRVGRRSLTFHTTTPFIHL